MPILRRTDTKESREYWEFVDKCAAEIEQMYQEHPWMRVYGEHMFCGQFCCRGNGQQTCREVVRNEH